MKGDELNHVLALALLVCVPLSSVGVSQQSSPAVASRSDAASATTIPDAWPAHVQINRLSDIGRGKAVIFSPDFTEPGNREFYSRLGFLYIEDASWVKALNRIIARNYWHPEDRIETIFLETHGTNGAGLKLQAGTSPNAARSYISLAALQEKLNGLGVRLCVIAACNAGRLFRPGIYKTVKPDLRERLFLPATLGIINASPRYDRMNSAVIMARRAESRIETSSYGDTSEFSPIGRLLFGFEARPGRSRSSHPLHFVVSNLLIQMLTHDRRLKLTASGYTTEKSRNDLSNAESEALFQRFLSYINDVAAREYQKTRPAQVTATRLSQTFNRTSHTSHASSTRNRKRRSARVID